MSDALYMPLVVFLYLMIISLMVLNVLFLVSGL